MHVLSGLWFSQNKVCVTDPVPHHDISRKSFCLSTNNTGKLEIKNKKTCFIISNPWLDV